MACVKSTNIVSTATIIITTVTLLGCFLITACQTLAEKEWKTNCFSDVKHGKCEDSVIQILSNHYSCDMVMEIDYPPTKIGFVNGIILVSDGTNTFFIRNEELQATKKNRHIPQWNEFFDSKLNKYFINKKGNAFMIDGQTQSQFEIFTSEDRSNSGIAFDVNEKVVLILSFNPGDIAGSLYALDTDSIKHKNGKVQATKVDGAGEDITAIVVEGGLEKLLLGIRTPEGGKIIRLTRQNQNPCSVNDEGKLAIVNLIEETKNKLLQIVSNVYSLPSQDSNRLVMAITGENSKGLETENKRLKKELLIAKAKLDSLTTHLLTLKENNEDTAGTEEGLLSNIYNVMPELIRSESGHILSCISTEDFEELKAENLNNLQMLIQQKSELKNKIYELSYQMENLLSD